MKIQENDPSITGWRPDRDELNEWLKSQALCTLSTVDASGAPMGATVAYSVTTTGELLIGTAENSRKSKNIDQDERVAVTVTDAETRYTVQMQGVAHKLVRVAFEHYYAQEHYHQRPQSLPFKDEAGQTHILVTPASIRFTDANPQPWAVTEFEIS